VEALLELQIGNQNTTSWTKWPPMSNELRENLYSNERTGKASIMDTSRLKIGKASFKNCLKSFEEISFSWKDGISDDTLRTALKRTFFQS